MRRLILIVAAVLAVGIGALVAAELTKVGFTRSTIDLGVIVGNLDKSAKFYTEALGFTEIDGFSVGADVAGESGLTASRPLTVRVFVLANEPAATRLKLMEFPDGAPKKIDTQYLHSTLGYRYLTLHVADTTASVARAKAAGVEPVKAPYDLGGGTWLTLVRDPDGNIIEFVGPKK